MLNDQDLTVLLGRPPIPDSFDPQELCGRAVLVTGAGGSIGSYLCEKLDSYPLKCLLLVERDEYRLYKIHQKIPHAIPILADYGDQQVMSSLMEAYGITDVFHVGAYKHVPLVERNPVAAVKNNVVGSLEFFKACVWAEVKNVTVVSTDKAVNPTNVMGATKAIVEALALSYPELKDRVRVVRFGNVLWSSGSVLPLFYSQMMAGKEVTVTDPEVTRYFMSIQEATTLILHAHLMSPGSYVLDMGEPVKIVDMVIRMGYMFEVTPKVKFIGLRPGEKLHEELATGGKLDPTSNPLIFSVANRVMDWATLNHGLIDLMWANRDYDVGKVRTLLMRLVESYIPQCGIVDPHWTQKFVINEIQSLDEEDCFGNTPEPK